VLVLVRRLKNKRDKWQAARWDKNHQIIKKIIDERYLRHAFSVSDIMESLKEKVEGTNRNHAADEGWIDEGVPSRQTVHAHLKQFVSEGEITWIRRGEYSSKTVSEALKEHLGRDSYDLLDWFMDQLQSYNVPPELLAEGRTLLQKHLLFLGGVHIFLEDFLFKELESQLPLASALIMVLGTKGETGERQDIRRLASLGVPSNLTIRMHASYGRPEPLKVGNGTVYGETWKDAAASLNPVIFNVTIAACCAEISLGRLYERVGKEAPRLFLGRMVMGEGREALQKTANDVLKIASWWINEISSYIPASGVLQLLTVLLIYNTRTFKQALAKIPPDCNIHAPLNVGPQEKVQKRGEKE